jgi:hypothetical protein
MTAAGWRWVISFGIGLLATGCTAIFPNGGPPAVIYNTPFGSTTILPGNQQPPPGRDLAVPPSGLAQSLPSPTMNADRSGVYAGLAVPLDTGGGLCITNQKVDRFRVHGKSVRWGRFRGTIDNNGLQMVFGSTWVYGQFVGNRFDGQITTSGRFDSPGCTFMMTLQKTG